jgi:hypothetical protein
MTQINWNALQSFDIGGAFNKGIEVGRQRAGEQAFSQLVIDPTNQNALAALARTDPSLAYKFNEQQRKTTLETQQRDVRMKAAQGDPNARQQLAGFDMNEYLALDKRGQEEYKQGIDTMGQLALLADTPEEWDDVVGQLAQAAPEFGKYRGRFDLRQSVIAQAGQAKELIEQNQPKYQVIPEGGMLVNTRDPQALSQVGAGGQPSAQGGPQPGAIEDGYRFKGGNPADPSSWEQIGDGPPPVSAAPQRANIMRRDEYQTFVRSMGREAADRWLASQGIQVENN